MTEPFEYAASNGRRGRHAAPSDQAPGLNGHNGHNGYPANGYAGNGYPDYGPDDPWGTGHGHNGVNGSAAANGSAAGWHGHDGTGYRSGATLGGAAYTVSSDHVVDPPAAPAHRNGSSPDARRNGHGGHAAGGQDRSGQYPVPRRSARHALPAGTQPAAPEPASSRTAPDLAAPSEAVSGTRSVARPGGAVTIEPMGGTPNPTGSWPVSVAAAMTADRYGAVDRHAAPEPGDLPARADEQPRYEQPRYELPAPRTAPGGAPIPSYSAYLTDPYQPDTHPDLGYRGGEGSPAGRSSDDLPVLASSTGPDTAEMAIGEAATGGQDDPGMRDRLTTLAGSVSDLASTCRGLASDLAAGGGAAPGSGGTQEAARLVGEVANGADGLLRLLQAARDTLDRSSWDGGYGYERSADHLADPAGTSHALQATSPTPHPREAVMPPELPSAAPSYPPVLPLGLRDGAQAAVVARQVEAARRHLMAALTVGHDVNDPAWRQQLLGMVEQVLAAVTEVATLAREALAPSAADTTFPGEARFLCVLPWEHVPVASPERSDSQATATGVARLLAALGYDSRAGRTEQGVSQVELRGTRYAARVLLQQLRLSGTGEWMIYLDWSGGDGQTLSGAETLGPAEVSDEELARRVDDAVRRRLASALD